MDLFWHLFQQSRIRQAEDTALEARHSVQEQELTVTELERWVERLTIVVIALAEILRDRHGTPVEVMEAKIQEVERRGVTLRPGPRRCAECGHVSGPAHANCMYCGKPLGSEPFLPEASHGEEQTPPP
jgi:hypothetical protein